jgi:hypothetical protein
LEKDLFFRRKQAQEVLDKNLDERKQLQEQQEEKILQLRNRGHRIIIYILDCIFLNCYSKEEI